MGSYATLCIGGYPIITSKSYVEPEVMTLFREGDKQFAVRKLPERNRMIWASADPDQNDEEETVVVYTCQAGKVIDRLNVMGFTLKRARADFESIRDAKLAEFAAWHDDDATEDWFADDWDLFKELTFDRYTSALKRVFAEGRRPVFSSRKARRESSDPVIDYLLNEDNDYPLGFPCSDVRSLVRLACDIVDPFSDVELDITELIDAGYYSVDEPVCESAVQSLLADHPQNAVRIILTEGSTDREILEAGLRLLYPHLYEYYSFMDFDSFRPPGGAGQLVSMIKAFAGAGITNRIIALFDNDTAANEAMRTLRLVGLPDNIAVLTYPDLELLRSYPTLGPSGKSNLDVNGLAASVELYLGSDVLFEGGAAYPVQWKGYSDAVGKYHGEVMHKDQIRAAFWRKMAVCRGSTAAFDTADWTGLRAIWGAVFRAFSSDD